MDKRIQTVLLSCTWVLGIGLAASGCSDDGGDASGDDAVTGAPNLPGASGAGATMSSQMGTMAPMAPAPNMPTGVQPMPTGTQTMQPMPTGTAGVGAGAGGAMAAGAGGTMAGGGGTMAGTGGAGGMMAGTGAAGTPPMPSGDGCTPAPPGTFQTTTEPGGPGGTYTIVRPSTLGEGGFLHPPVAWGNGLGTTPPLYAALLEEIASHGFVVIANPGPGSSPQPVREGLEWLIDQNGSGQFAGVLAVDCAGTIGYSMGGGAAVGSGAHPAVKAIVSIHGLQDAAERASGPILLTTSEGDTFVTKSGFVEPCYRRSTVQPTILASHAGGDHLDPLGNGGEDAAPAVAWLRYWIYGDQAQRDWFFGDDCTLCSWPDFRRKNHPEWD